MIATPGKLDTSYVLVHPDEFTRLMAVDAAVREYAELGQALDDWTPNHPDTMYLDRMIDRHSEAYRALRALFAPAVPVATTGEGNDDEHTTTP